MPDPAARADDYEAFWGSEGANDGDGGDDSSGGGGGRGSRRRVAAAVTAALVLVALAGVARSTASGGGPEPAVLARLRAEADGLVASGLAPDHPKVETLRREIDALADGWGDDGRSEPGVDLQADAEAGELAGSPDEARRRAAEAAEAGRNDPAGGSGGPDDPAGEGPGGDRESDAGAGTAGAGGAVACEPVPGALTAEEVAGARCLNVPQPDGSSRYVVVRPHGVAHVVSFVAGGGARRLADIALPERIDPMTAELVPLATGRLEVRHQGTTPTAVDLG